VFQAKREAPSAEATGKVTQHLASGLRAAEVLAICPRGTARPGQVEVPALATTANNIDRGAECPRARRPSGRRTRCRGKSALQQQSATRCR
jgi:hypothetical protein